MQNRTILWFDEKKIKSWMKEGFFLTETEANLNHWHNGLHPLLKSKLQKQMSERLSDLPFALVASMFDSTKNIERLFQMPIENRMTQSALITLTRRRHSK